MSYPYEEKQKKSYKGLKEDKGNWTCSKCQNVNWSWRIECNKCHEPAPENIIKKNQKLQGDRIGQPVFHATDWICKKCGNVNWESRKACNLCGMEKEKDQGKRDGAGGGFNDRQDPTDRRTTNSDDDDMYDAFGRKKKKYRIGGVHSITSQPEDKEEDLPDQDNTETTHRSRSRSREHSHHSHKHRHRHHHYYVC